MYLILEGAKKNPHLVSLNLSQNELGAGLVQTAFSSLLGMFEPSPTDKDVINSTSLEELILSNNHLSNKHIEQISGQIKVCGQSSLRKLDLSSNKLGIRGVLSLF